MRTTLVSLRMLAVLALLTGAAYPLLVTGVAWSLWPAEAAGSLVLRDGRPVGSELLAQPFSGDRWFWPRPSATGYATVPGGASNLAPTSAGFGEAVGARARAFRDAHGLGPGAAVPADMLSTSASGLDPHISLAAAVAQVGRVAAARGMDGDGQADLRRLVEASAEGPQWATFGVERVNVLKLNLALDALPPPP